jgi:hypothetical protein
MLATERFLLQPSVLALEFPSLILRTVAARGSRPLVGTLKRTQLLGSGAKCDGEPSGCLSSGLPTITKANVWKSAVDTISIAVGNSSGAPDPAEYATFQTYMERYKPALCTFVFSTCTTYAVHLGGQIQVRYSDLATAQAQFELRMTEFFARIQIGGTVRINELIATIWQVPGIQSLTLRNASGALYAQTDDIALTASQLATYTNAMTWVTV